MADKPISLQDHFLNSARRAKAPVAIFLVKGVKLTGVISWFDAFSILLRRDGGAQLVYKHAISTILPTAAMPDFAAQQTAAHGKASLQDLFLSAASREQESMTLYLVTGVMLQGSVAGFDQFSILLDHGGELQLVYKHAISTMQPARPLNLGGGEPIEDLEDLSAGPPAGERVTESEE